jgi:hypothetical protein
MRALPITRLVPGLLLGALGTGCPASSDGPGDGNPKVLWLATNLTETQVKLVDTEPAPF